MPASRRSRPHPLPLLLLLLVTLAAASACPTLADVQVTDAYLREAPPGQRVNAGFMTLTNTGTERVTLLAAHAGRASSVELHTHVERDGRLRMLKLPHVHLAPGSSKRFVSGGLHLMVFNLAPRARAGTSVLIELEFDDGTRQQVPFEVRRVFDEL